MTIALDGTPTLSALPAPHIQNDPKHRYLSSHLPGATVNRIPLPRPVTPASRVTLQIGREGEVFWASIPELDIHVESEEIKGALWDVMAAAREWLEYLCDESPELGHQLASHPALC